MQVYREWISSLISSRVAPQELTLVPADSGIRVLFILKQILKNPFPEVIDTKDQTPVKSDHERKEHPS